VASLATDRKSGIAKGTAGHQIGDGLFADLGFRISEPSEQIALFLL
jgi:hypothetical protein